MKASIILGGTILLVFIAAYFLLKPEYDFFYYELESCEDTSLTAIVYWELGERGIIFAEGVHQKKPDHNYMKTNQMSGFDAMFDCIVTCTNGVVTLNYYEGYFVPEFTSESIRLRRVDNDTYDSLMNSLDGERIRLY